MNLINRLNSFKESFTRNSKINFGDEELSKTHVPMEIDDDSLEMALEDIEFDYGTDIREFSEILRFCGNKLCWTHLSDEFTYGGFYINGLWESLCEPSTFWYSDFSIAIDENPPDDLKHFEEINWFEKQAWGDDGRYGCIIREKGIFPPKMSFYDEGWRCDMSLNLFEYIDAMFASCGIKGWQYFYVKIPKEHPKLGEILKEMEQSVRLLPQIFPSMDFSYNKAKLEEVKGM